MLSIAVALLERTVRDRLESTALRQALGAGQVGSQSGTTAPPAVHGEQHTLSLLAFDLVPFMPLHIHQASINV